MGIINRKIKEQLLPGKERRKEMESIRCMYGLQFISRILYIKKSAMSMKKV